MTDITDLIDNDLLAIIDRATLADVRKHTAGSVMNAISVGLAADLELSHRALARLKARGLARAVIDQHDPGDEDIDAWAERLGADVAQARDE